MGHDDDSQFIHCISAIESGLLDFQSSRVDDFYQEYNEYTKVLEAAIRANVLSPSITALAAALSIKVYYTVKSSLDVESLSQKLMGSFLDETAAILESSTTNTSPPPSLISESSLAPYIKPSYEWLVANIHNPYPSPEIRDVITRKSGAARKDVDHWFMDARKRIGWIDARKTYFSNKRAHMIDAATRFYANDEKLSLSQGAEHALISIMKNAKDLYCDKFSQTPLASKLDAAVIDLTPQTKADAKAERLCQVQMKKARDSYPSPERSPEPAEPSPTPCDGDIDNTTTQSISITSRKRRNILVESVDVHKIEGTRPVKRARLDGLSSLSSPKITPLPTDIPSPVSLIDEPLPAAELSDLSSSSSPTAPSRKRRLSESDTQGVPKRLRNLPPGPRLQVVSDPLPVPSALFDPYSTPFDGWFEQSFDLSNGFDDGGNDLTSFDFELGTIPDAGCKFDLHAEPSLDNEQTLELSAPAMPPESHCTTSTKDFSFEELQSLWPDASLSINPDNPGQVAAILGNTCVPPLLSIDFELLNHTNGFYSPSTMDSVTRPYSLSNPDLTWGFLDMPIPLTCDRTSGITSEKPLLAPEDFSGLPAASVTPSSYYEDDCRTPELLPGQKR